MTVCFTTTLEATDDARRGGMGAVEPICEWAPTIRSGQRQPADSLRDKSSLVPGWSPSVTAGLMCSTVRLA